MHYSLCCLSVMEPTYIYPSTKEATQHCAPSRARQFQVLSSDHDKEDILRDALIRFIFYATQFCLICLEACTIMIAVKRQYNIGLYVGYTVILPLQFLHLLFQSTGQTFDSCDRIIMPVILHLVLMLQIVLTKALLATTPIDARHYYDFVLVNGIEFATILFVSLLVSVHASRVCQ